MLNKFLIVAAIIIGAGWLAASVQGALMPFVLAAVIAYVSTPLAARIEAKNFSAAASATVIVILFLLVLLLVPLALLPLVVSQIHQLAAFMPAINDKLHTLLGVDTEWITHIRNNLDAVGADGLNRAAELAADVLGGGVSLAVSFLTLLLIAPLATFYFVRDRAAIGGRLSEMLPPRIRDSALAIGRDLNAVLDEFLHGQLLVMIIMSVFFSAVLAVAGLPFALTVGILSGLLTFIPYLGFIIGLALATLIGLGAFDSFVDIAIVWALMIFGTILENLLITPRLVGERVGLHPLAVLFSIAAMGELFGFIGVLAALPVAAALLVCGRHLRHRYIASGFYGRT